MDHDNGLNGYSDNLQPPQIEQPALYNNNYFSTTDNNNTIQASYTNAPINYEQQPPMFSNNEHASSTMSYASQHTARENQNNFSTLNSSNSSQTSNPEISFEIPIIIRCIITFPASSIFANLNTSDMQNQFQQNYSSNIIADNLQFQQSSSIANDNLQPQFQQDYNSSNIVNDNSQIQFQQNPNESSVNFNNFCG
jgi:hypothetical protein